MRDVPEERVERPALPDEAATATATYEAPTLIALGTLADLTAVGSFFGDT